MSGYKDYSMSNNAISAYEDGEKPISKWTKSELLYCINDIRDDLDFSKLTVSELKETFLYQSSYHHTSKHYNITYFYSIDEEKVKEFTQDKINEIKDSRKKIVRRDKTTIELEKKRKEELKKIKVDQQREKEEVEKLFKYQDKYKTLKRFLNSNMDLEELREKRATMIKEKRKELKSLWEKQLTSDDWRWDNIEDDNFIESYIR